MSKHKRSIRDKAAKAKKVVKLGPAQIPMQESYSTGFSSIDIGVFRDSRRIGSLQGITYNTSRERVPIYEMGSSTPTAYSHGPAFITGTITFPEPLQYSDVGRTINQRESFDVRLSAVSGNRLAQMQILGIEALQDTETRGVFPYIARAILPWSMLPTNSIGATGPASPREL